MGPARGRASSALAKSPAGSEHISDSQGKGGFGADSRSRSRRPLNVDSGRWASKDFLCRNSRHHHPRHFRIKPANTIGANDKIGRIENLRLYEIKHRSINPRSLRLH
jgi:hypothetical protein